MLALELDTADLDEMLNEAVQMNLKVAKQATTTLRAVSFAVEKRVKKEMPVDTGRARASWGHWTQQSMRGVNKYNVPQGGDAVWVEADNGFSITQGSNVPYIGALNAGHSRKAPAGFIDRAGLMGQLMLEEELGLIDPLSAEYQGRLFVAQYG